MKKIKIISTLFLVFAITCSSIVLPLAFAWNDATSAAVAAGMKWDFPGAENIDASDTRLLLWDRYQDKIPTVVWGLVSPNPVGVNQQLTILLFNPVAPPMSLEVNDVRWEYSVEVTDPEGITQRIPDTGTIVSDSTGAAYTVFTPTKVGQYSFTIKFHEMFYQWYEGAGSYGLEIRDYYGVTFLESTDTVELTVQEDPVNPAAITTYPLPNEYWTRPIEGQNQEWGQISSNWLNNAKDLNYGSTGNRYQPEGVAPNSAHILWTKPLEDAGVVGGDEYFSVPGEVFNTGSPPYQPRFQTQIIMHGRLYYELPNQFNSAFGSGGGWVCVDLKTGEEIWRGDYGIAGSGMPDLSFGYYYDLDNMNEHGIVNPGWIFATSGSTWYSVHPQYGTFGQFNVTNVPSLQATYPGTEVIGQKGEILRIITRNYGTADNPDWHLLQWNSSKVFPDYSSTFSTDVGVTFDADTPSAYDYNISIPLFNSLSGNITPLSVSDDTLLCYNGTLNYISLDYRDGGFYHNPDYATFFSVSLDPHNLGDTVFDPTNIEMASSDGTWLGYVRAGEGVFVLVEMPEFSWVAYSMETGEKLWQSAPETDIYPFGYYSYMYACRFLTGIADGKFFSTGYSGHTIGYDLYDGELLWTYAAATNGLVLEYYTAPKYCIADGKIYLGSYEHTPDTPLYKGNRVRCVDVNTGEELWNMLGYATQHSMAIADGVLIYWNQYDGQVYSVGKGPSSLSATAGPKVVELGSSVLIEGSVIDISAGTKQNEQAARFPNGVPAVSDESMGEWMEYVYMQKPRPTDVTGVTVIFSAIDPNGNYMDIDRTITDSYGNYAYAFKPEMEGTYQITATFEGTESYYGSITTTYLQVDPAPTVATPIDTEEPTIDAETPASSEEPTPFLTTEVTIILAVAVAAVICIVAYWSLKHK